MRVISTDQRDKLAVMIRMFWIVIVLFALACFPQCLFAWNDTGHMTVALIAYRQLNDHQRQQVAALLKEHPHYKLYLTEHRPEGVSEDEWAFLRASTWPDFVRPSRPGGGGGNPELFKGPEITHYHQGPWHYVDIAWVPPLDRKTMNPATLPSRQEPNALTALQLNAKTLSTADAKPADRAVSLAWLEHLIGDVHQPLHAARMYSPMYPNGDMGGNAQAIRAGGPPMNLHAYWDDALGNSDAYTAIAFLADQITGDPQLQPAKIPELAKDTTFDSWANESYEYAIALVYLNGRLRSVPMQQWQSREIKEEEVPVLPPSYAANAHDLAKRRIATAGYRLAEQIKSLLGE